MNTLSFAWRGGPGSGKRTQLLQFLEKRATKHGVQFKVKDAMWYLTKPSNGSADPDEEDEEGGTSKTIPYEESAIHMGFDVARMSMSDKLFLQSILGRWTGQQDVILSSNTLPMRYLVLYHAHYLTDESTLQLQEALEQFPSFAVLFTTELPVCPRLRDMFFEIAVPYKAPLSNNSAVSSRTEIPVAYRELNDRGTTSLHLNDRGCGGTTSLHLKESDKLLANYVAKAHLPATDVWATYFDQTVEAWSSSWTPGRVQEVRNGIYMCLQRNLRWTDVIRHWIEATYRAPWMTPEKRRRIMRAIWRAESGSGWVLVTSYRIPILWETVHLEIARTLYEARMKSSSP
jgi:hypothetical protein